MLTMMTGAWAKCTDHIPHLFLIGAAGGKLKLNLDRIAEAVIIAVIIGAIMGWTLKPTLERIEQRIDKIYDDIYSPSIPTKEGKKDVSKRAHIVERLPPKSIPLAFPLFIILPCLKKI